MRIQLSRYAIVRRDGDGLVAESAASPRTVDLDHRGLALLRGLTRARLLEEAAADAGLSLRDARDLAAPLLTAGILVRAEASTREETSAWWLHDLLLHTRTRSGLVLAPPYSVPPPALPPARGEDTVALAVPDLDAIERTDPPLAAVQAARRSIREHGTPPIAVDSIAELLYRVGRVDDIWYPGPGMTFATRPYPSAGALYELELYLAAGECDGLPRGLYRYVADRHLLARVTATSPDVDGLLDSAAAGMAARRRPQTVIVLAARFERIAWKYGPLAYTLVLKDVGVLMQTLYLATTAMGLAGCAVGTGDARLFAKATGLDRDEEVSVGEFAVGTRPG